MKTKNIVGSSVETKAYRSQDPHFGLGAWKLLALREEILTSVRCIQSRGPMARPPLPLSQLLRQAGCVESCLPSDPLQ